MTWKRGLTYMGVILWGAWLGYIADELVRTSGDEGPSAYSKGTLVIACLVPGVLLLGMRWVADRFESRARSGRG